MTTNTAPTTTATPAPDDAVTARLAWLDEQITADDRPHEQAAMRALQDFSRALSKMSPPGQKIVGAILEVCVDASTIQGEAQS